MLRTWKGTGGGDSAEPAPRTALILNLATYELIKVKSACRFNGLDVAI